MTQIDEKSLESILERLVDPWHRKFACDVVAAYESAKAPRTISRDELERAALKVQHDFSTKFGRTGNLYASDIRTILSEAIATLGITVEGVKMPTDDEMTKHLYEEFEALDKLRDINKPNYKPNSKE